MFAWWEALDSIQKIFAAVAIPATIIMILQTIMLLFGMGHDGGADAHMDADTDGDGHFDTHSDSDGSWDISGLRIFTVRGIITFFAIGGWFGVFFKDIGASDILSALGAMVTGLIAMVIIAVIFKAIMRMQDDGNISLKNAIGKDATVYLTIPGNMERTGKITMDLQGRYTELEALTKEKEPIKTGKIVRIVDVINGTTLLVEEKIKDQGGVLK